MCWWLQGILLAAKNINPSSESFQTAARNWYLAMIGIGCAGKVICLFVTFIILIYIYLDVIPVGRKRRSDNLSRKKRQNIREICYCPRKMRRGWTKRFSECCKHPVRKFMNANHPFLYDAECVALGLPSVG